MSEVFACEFADGDTGGSRACGIDGVSFDSSREECHHPLTMEDARLFAAARELLAALRDSLRWIAKVAADHDDDLILHGQAMRAHDKARAVIRKAEGAP